VTDPTHLVLKILPHALSAQVRDRGDVLGEAIVDERGVGYYAYAFYDRVQRVAEERQLGHALLGAVLAHEIGHLLLGSNCHTRSRHFVSMQTHTTGAPIFCRCASRVHTGNERRAIARVRS
jgi:hypothetical protein